MATVEKNFRIKQGLTVEGASGTINGSNILTEATVAYPTIPNVFGTISANGTSVVADSSTDTLTLTPGSGITITGDAGSDTITIANSDTGSAQNIFKTVSANGTSIVADSNTDTLTITPSTGITIVGDSDNDTVTITNSGVTSVTGTDNEITVSAGTGSVTIGLPDDVTIGNNLTVTGNLTVNGTTTTLNTDTLAVEDNIIMLNTNVTGTPAADAGIEVERGDYTNAKIFWKESANAWYLATPADDTNAATEAVISTGGSVNLFNTISDGSNTASPDSSTDTLTFSGSGAVTVVVNGTTDTVTIGTNATAAMAVGAVTLPDASLGSATATASGSTVDLDTWAVATYSTAKYLIQAKNGSGDIEVTELLVTVDGSNNVYITEYANMFSNASLAEFTAAYATSNVTVSATSTTSGVVFKVSKTYIEA